MCHVPSDLIQLLTASQHPLSHTILTTPCEVERDGLNISVYLIGYEPGTLSYTFPIITLIILCDNYAFNGLNLLLSSELHESRN